MKNEFMETGQYLRINKNPYNIEVKPNLNNDDLTLFRLVNEEKEIVIEASIKNIFEDKLKAFIESFETTRFKLIEELKSTSKPHNIKNLAQFKRLLDTNLKVITVFIGSSEKLNRLGKEVLKGMKQIPAKDFQFYENYITLDNKTFYFLEV